MLADRQSDVLPNSRKGYFLQLLVDTEADVPQQIEDNRIRDLIILIQYQLVDQTLGEGFQFRKGVIIALDLE